MDWEHIITKHTLGEREKVQLANALIDEWDKWEGRTDPQFNSESILLLKVYEAIEGKVVPEMGAIRIHYPNYGSAVLRTCYLLEDLNESLFQKVCKEFNACKKIKNMKKSDLPIIITGIADLLASIVGIIPAITVSTLVVRYGLDKYCGCDETKSGNANARKPLTEKHISYIKHAAGNSPNNTYRALEWLARKHIKAGRQKLAKQRLKDAEKVVRASSAQVVELNEIAYGHIELGNYKKAAQLASEVAEEHPNDAAILDTFGWALLGAGKNSQAEKILQRAVSLDVRYSFDEGSFEIRYHLVATLIKNKKKKNAKQVIDEMKIRDPNSEWTNKATELLQ